MQPAAHTRTLVYLPNTCPENRKHHTHLRLLDRVMPDAWNAAGFEGRVLWPGARLSAEELGENAVILECAGPQGIFKRRARPWLYILWRYDGKMWREVARALAFDWSWALTLREPAIRALAAPGPEKFDAAVRGREVAEELLAAIDLRLAPENGEARAVALSSIYEQLAGRITEAARCSLSATAPRPT